MPDLYPPRPPPKPLIWCTYVPDRRPKWKLYNNRGHALTALKYAPNRWAEGVLWQLVDSEWVVIDHTQLTTPPWGYESYMQGLTP